MTVACPSDLRLEAYLLDPERSGLTSHVDACEPCRARLAEMHAEADHFRQFVFPATVDAVLDAAVPRQRPGWFATLVPFAALGAAALLLLVRPVPPEGFLAARGETLSLEVLAESPDGPRTLTSGELIPQNAPLRFRVHSTVPCRVRVVSVDCEGRVTTLLPAAGDELRVTSGANVLPGSAALPGDEGPERIYAFCSREPLPMLALADSLKDQSAGDDDRVRRTDRISGLPPGTLQATLLVEHGEEKPGHDHPEK